VGKDISLKDLHDRRYRYNVIADPDGGWVIEFPDLPGCFTQADDPEEIVPMAEDAKRAWIEAAYDLGREIPEPTYPDLQEYSGKFIMRVPKKLHMELAEQAKRNGVSLNSWVTYLLTERSVLARRAS
jgi:antitoxin HicB